MPSFLLKEDYEEPCCPLTSPDAVMSIPTRRIIDKLDEYMETNDYSGAERHLAYWTLEAEFQKDQRGRLTLLNEQIGLFRKTGQKEKGLKAIRDAIALSDALDLKDSITMGTTLVNAATAYRSFDMPREALPLYERARSLYEDLLSPEDPKLGALYNNMALTEMALSSFDAAEAHFFQALSIMESVENGEIEMAVTYCNLADLSYAAYDPQTASRLIKTYLSRAKDLLMTESLPHDGYFTYVVEKCAPAFGFYGDKETETLLIQLQQVPMSSDEHK